MNYSLRIYNEEHKLIRCRRTSKIKRFYHYLQAEENSETQKYRLSVKYLPGFDVWGKKVAFTNEGEYSSIPEVIHALKCFMEVDDTRR